MEKTGSVVRTGNSLAVVVPAHFVKRLGIKARDKVIAKQDYRQGTITYTFLNVRQLTLV